MIAGLTYLYGITDYGDAVEDEWLIVFMLRQLTESFRDLWVRIVDADGEILLIEAANTLPKWITPETDQNRVWIHDSKLFIIPPSPAADALQVGSPTTITLRNAVDYIRTKPNALVNSPLIESEAFYRLEKYPDHVNQSMHHSLVTIPRRLASILHAIPKSVSLAVEMFYLRDAITLKSITSPSAPLAFPPKDFVTTSVQFTKVLFAQLKSQHFEPPLRWEAFIKDASETSLSDLTSPTRRDMGMKLTCGYEMLSVDAEKSRHRVVRELALLLQDLADDGDATLPSDAEIGAWPNHMRDDPEDWMDINYQNFERELDGKRRNASRVGDPDFGDSQAQNDLRKIVSRFDAFLNDDKAGLDGVDPEEMEGDDVENSEDDDDDSEFEDKAVSFDEEAFAQMMREMMGIPGRGKTSDAHPNHSESDSPGQLTAEDVGPVSDDLRQLSSQMETELRRHGALSLKPETHKQLNKRHKDQLENGQPQARASEAAEDNEEELNIDYNLAQNILESFKGQAGMAGPTGNILGMMGFTLPRDDDDVVRKA